MVGLCEQSFYLCHDCCHFVAGLQCIQARIHKHKGGVYRRNSTPSLQKKWLTTATMIWDKVPDDQACSQMGHHVKMPVSGRAVESGCAHASVLTHLTPPKRVKKTKVERASFQYQGQCKECQKKTTWHCSDCNETDNTVFLCATKNGKWCYLDHIAHAHTHHADLDDYIKHSVNVSIIFHFC